MRFALAVHGSPCTYAASRTALRFARAALASGHTIQRVFFYHDGVYNGSALSVPPQDEEDLTEAWAALGRAHQLDLVICIASALKRGMLDAGEAERYEMPASNVRPEFAVSGLGQLVDAAIDADRLVTFGV